MPKKTPPRNAHAPLIGIVMGSRSDWDTMQHAAETLSKLGVAHEVQVVSAHRTPDLLFSYAEGAEKRGLLCIIAGAGGAAHLPGMLAAKTAVPVLGVPVQSHALSGLDSLLSIVQMPAGVPVATFAIGKAGAVNAALFGAALVAIAEKGASAEKAKSKGPKGGKSVGAALERFLALQTADVLAHPDPRLPK